MLDGPIQNNFTRLRSRLRSSFVSRNRSSIEPLTNTLSLRPVTFISAQTTTVSLIENNPSYSLTTWNVEHLSSTSKRFTHENHTKRSLKSYAPDKTLISEAIISIWSRFTNFRWVHSTLPSTWYEKCQHRLVEYLNNVSALLVERSYTDQNKIRCLHKAVLGKRW